MNVAKFFNLFYCVIYRHSFEIVGENNIGAPDIQNTFLVRYKLAIFTNIAISILGISLMLPIYCYHSLIFAKAKVVALNLFITFFFIALSIALSKIIALPTIVTTIKGNSKKQIRTFCYRF